MSLPIVHLRSTFQVGGPEKLILSGIRQMSGDDFDFTLSTFSLPARPNRFAEYASSLGIKVVQIPITGAFDRRAIDGVRRLVKDSGARLLVVHDYRAVIIALLARIRPRIPILAVAHGWTAQTLRVRVYEFFERMALRRVDAVVAVSKPKYQELLGVGVSEDRLHLIENGVDIPSSDKRERITQLKDDLGFDHDTVLIGSVARLSPEKGQRHLVAAAARLVSISPKARFVVFGEGPLRSSLLAQIKQLHLEDRFFLPGWRTDMEAVYRGLDIFVLPSLTEGLPMALLEAMAYGLPVVATTVGGCPDVIVDNQSGLLVPPADSDSLRIALDQLVQDEPLRVRFSHAAYERVSDAYAMTRYATQFGQLYTRLLSVTP